MSVGVTTFFAEKSKRLTELGTAKLEIHGWGAGAKVGAGERGGGRGGGVGGAREDDDGSVGQDGQGGDEEGLGLHGGRYYLCFFFLFPLLFLSLPLPLPLPLPFLSVFIPVSTEASAVRLATATPAMDFTTSSRSVW